MVLAVGVVGAIGVTAVLAAKVNAVSQQVFKGGGGGSILDVVKPGDPLKTDGHGRTNILVFGTSQDDGDHQANSGAGGPWLTDSIELVSVDNATKRVTLVAIPRDLWVKLPKPCVVGYEAKINAVYECASGLYNDVKANPATYDAQDAAGAQSLMSVVQTVTGLTSQYWAHVDYSVLRDAVNAVGGISVDIVGDGANGIYDNQLDTASCRASKSTGCRRVYYPHNGTYEINGQQALDLARSRGDYNPYSYRDFGLARGDFDRQINQQKIISALKVKATSAGVLANPVTIFNLMSALGSNVTTSMSEGEAKTLIGLANSSSEPMQSISLATPPHAVLTTGWNPGHTQSIVLPSAGLYDYSQIQQVVATVTLQAPTPTNTTGTATSSSGG